VRLKARLLVILRAYCSLAHRLGLVNLNGRIRRPRLGRFWRKADRAHGRCEVEFRDCRHGAAASGTRQRLATESAPPRPLNLLRASRWHLASSRGLFVISSESFGGEGLRGRPGFAPSWRPLDMSRPLRAYQRPRLQLEEAYKPRERPSSSTRLAYKRERQHAAIPPKLRKGHAVWCVGLTRSKPDSCRPH
jgi:hypothetical protein